MQYKQYKEEGVSRGQGSAGHAVRQSIRSFVRPPVVYNMVQAQWTGAQARWGKCVCVYVCVCVCLAEIGLGGNLWSPVHLGAQAVGCTHKLLEPLSRGELLEPLGRGG